MTQRQQTPPVLSLETTYNYVTRALQLLEKPGPGIQGSSWIKNAEAITTQPKGSIIYVKPEDERAEAWCFIGSLKAVTKYDPNPEAAYLYLYACINAANALLLSANHSTAGKAGAAPQINDNALSFGTVRQLLVNTQNFLIRKGA